MSYSSVASPHSRRSGTTWAARRRDEHRSGSAQEPQAGLEAAGRDGVAPRNEPGETTHVTGFWFGASLEGHGSVRRMVRVSPRRIRFLLR